MALVYKQAKDILAQYAGRGGRCASAADIDSFVREVFEYLLIQSGADQDLRKYTFMTDNQGVITVPYEIDSIQKVEIDDRVGQVWDKWFDFRSSSTMSAKCLPASDALYEEANTYPTVYSIKQGGARICTLGTCDESEDAHIIVEGKDLTGRQIYTTHKGQQISGEYLSIKKGMKMFSQVTFGEITGILKSKTNGYVQLLGNNGQFLSDYSPLEQIPKYKRYRISSLCSGGCEGRRVTVLARIRLKEAYADNDQIPFDTMLTLRMAGQHVNAQYNNNPELAAAKEVAITNMIEKQAAHGRVNNGAPIEVMYATSAGKVKNAQARGIRRSRFRGLR